MPRTSERLATARSTCSAAARRFWSPAAIVRADCSSRSCTVAISSRARATPWKRETSTTGSKAKVMITCSRRRSVHPGSRPMLLMLLFGAFLADELLGAARAELIELRHDLTSRVPSCWPRDIVQRVAAVENLYQGLARAGNPAFHRADRAFADRRRIFIGKAAGADQDQRLALLVGKMFERAHRVGQFRGMNLILATTRNPFGRVLIPGRLPPGPTAVGIELVAQDGEKPGLEIGARDETGAALPRLYQGFLRQIVCGFLVAGQRAREGAQKRHQAQKFGFEVRILGLRGLGRRGRGMHHDTFFPLLSSASSI